jgi:hypothetical protein
MDLAILIHAIGTDPMEIAALTIPGSLLFGVGLTMAFAPVLRAQPLSDGTDDPWIHDASSKLHGGEARAAD